MAPEMINRENQTPAIDIYSLGATLYYALTAKPPYTGKNIEEILQKHINEPVPDLATLLTESSPSLVDLVKRMMAKNPENRPSSADVTATLRAEAISWKIDETAMLSSSGMIFPHDSRIGTPAITAPKAPAALSKRPLSRLFCRRFLVSAFLALIFILIIISLSTIKFWLPTKTTFFEYDQLFPNSPQTYGVLPSETILTPIQPDITNPPPFSWKGKIDISGFKFIASKSGRHFYPINSSRAVLIRADNFVGYKSANDAILDGKILAP
jgi:serine/threonine protein kinase